ncbi:hypothetical protein ACJJIE_03450 [Microbulbifer sp. TRSA001]|uniref:hypothetical protein n=1 Tax=Microbulbifer sp. TRSA001 TaxID=3243381 RepID=UPI00403937DA
MNRSMLNGCIVLGVVFLLCAVTFLIIRLVLHLDAEITANLLSHLSLIAVIFASIIALFLVGYAVYSIFQSRQHFVRKILLIGHSQPKDIIVNEYIKKSFPLESLEPVSVPADFIGNVLPKIKWQLQRLRGSWFLPAPRLLLTFNVLHLQSIQNGELEKYLHDIVSLSSEVSPWGKKLEVHILVHNMDVIKGYSTVHTQLFNSEVFWSVADPSSFDLELLSLVQSGLHQLPDVSSERFSDLLDFSNSVSERKKEVCDLLKGLVAIFGRRVDVDLAC